MSNWQYWNGNNAIEEDVNYLGIYKDLSGSFTLRFEEGKPYIFDDELDKFVSCGLAILDQDLGYFIKQDIVQN